MTATASRGHPDPLAPAGPPPEAFEPTVRSTPSRCSCPVWWRGGGTHNAVIVATEQDSMYAFGIVYRIHGLDLSSGRDRLQASHDRPPPAASNDPIDGIFQTSEFSDLPGSGRLGRSDFSNCQ